MSEEQTAEAIVETEKTPILTSPNMQFKNKYAIGDIVWAVFVNGPNLKVNQFEIKSLNCEVIGFDEPAYIYGFTIDGDGYGDGVNLIFIQENLCFFSRVDAEKKAKTMIGEVLAQYDQEIEQETRTYEKKIQNLNEQKSKVNANNLEVEPREVEVPPQEEPKADTETPVMTPDEEQSNPSSDVGTETDTNTEKD